MTVDQMRYDISKIYPGVKWKRKVDKMSDNQVIAVYYNFERSGKFIKLHRVKPDEPTKKKQSDKPEFKQPSGEQISIFDIYN